MKRLLPILLVALLLSACGNAQTQEPTETTEPTQPALVSLYEDSAVETQTQGAVRAYPLEKGPYWMLGQSRKDCFVAANDQGRLVRIQSQTGEVLADEVFPVTQWTSKDIVATEKGVLYFHRENRQVVILNEDLEQTQVVSLPEDSVGDPLIQASGQVFYCAGNQIRALDLQTGVSRLVREHRYGEQTLVGSYFDDTILGCQIIQENGAAAILYLSAQTGQEVFRDEKGYTLQTGGSRYFAALESVGCITGIADGLSYDLMLQETAAAGVLALNGAVGYQLTEDGLALSYYNLTTGKRTAEVTLPVQTLPKAVESDGQFIWLLIENTLYRWDVTATIVSQDAVYLQQRYTLENPDAEGLAQCQSRVQQFRDTYGLDLYIWQDAMTVAYERAESAEYRVEEIQQSLDAVEEVLKKLPKDFLQTTGDISFYLVGELKNGQPCTQYWEGAECRVVMDCRQPALSFLKGLGVGVDTRVLGNSREFDAWEKLNPRKFKYTYDYEENSLREDGESYLDYFIHQDAMSFPTEDRSWIFAYACLPEGAEYFQKDGLQDKLQRICEGIREAYHLEEYAGPLPWEQHLHA